MSVQRDAAHDASKALAWDAVAQKNATIKKQRIRIEALEDILLKVVLAGKAFRALMPPDWEGDHLQDAIDAASSFVTSEARASIGEAETP